VRVVSLCHLTVALVVSMSSRQMSVCHPDILTSLPAVDQSMLSLTLAVFGIATITMEIS
jgi:hypothetical protein